MAEMMVLVALIGLIVYGVERNNARHRYPRSRLSGSAVATDRDAERMSTDLTATRAHSSTNGRHFQPAAAMVTRIPSAG